MNETKQSQVSFGMKPQESQQQQVIAPVPPAEPKLPMQISLGIKPKEIVNSNFGKPKSAFDFKPS